MSREPVVVAGALLLGSRFLIAQAPPAESYGGGIQSVHVGAAAFQPSDGDHDYGLDVLHPMSDGYLYNHSQANLNTFVAPLTLPAGAEVLSLCLYAYDVDPLYVEAQLFSARLAPGGLEPGLVSIGPILRTYWDFGYGVVCGDLDPPYAFRETAGDGAWLAHYIKAQVWPTGGQGALGGVKVVWRRAVSPPPATPTFGDVPTTHGFFQFVEALAASGITAGCGDGNFCPDSPLTRGQMAVFLARALGLHWPY